MVPSTSETKPINATNKCIMNVKSERRSDSGNFGAGITEFRVVVGKIRWLEVSMATVWIFLGLRTSLELFFKNQGSDCETSRLQVDYPKVHGPFYKISEFNRNNELFMYRKSRGLGPWVVDHSRVERSTVDLWRRGQEGGVLGLIGARAAVWGLSDGDDVAVEEKLGGNSAQASGEGEKSGGGCGENRWRSLPFIGAVRL
jgi:hypothetical protein